MKITKIWFTADHIFGRDEEGKEYSQSLLWYPKLRAASDEERSSMKTSVSRALPMKIQSRQPFSVSS